MTTEVLEEEQTEEQETEVEQEEQTETETTEETKTEEPAAEEITVAIGDETPKEEEKAPEWVREVRRQNRELVKRNRELEAQVSGKAPALGKKPEMSDPDIDYDAAKFEPKLAEWYEKKRAADAAAEQETKAQEEQQKAWQGKLEAYGTSKAALKVKDFDDAEALVLETLSTNQQAIIVQGAKNPALVVFALGKNPGKRAELAAIKNPVEFAFAVANLETQLKVTKKTPPPPERQISGSAPKSGVTGGELDRLRAEAEKTGDYTKVNAYKREHRKT